jgi:hypothetical protein
LGLDFDGAPFADYSEGETMTDLCASMTVWILDSMDGQTYTIQSTTNPVDGPWVDEVTLTGNGEDLAWDDVCVAPGEKFYRTTTPPLAP